MCKSKCYVEGVAVKTRGESNGGVAGGKDKKRKFRGAVIARRGVRPAKMRWDAITSQAGRYVRRERLGPNVPSTRTRLLMRTWQLLSIAKTLTTLRAARRKRRVSNG